MRSFISLSTPDKSSIDFDSLAPSELYQIITSQNSSDFA